MPTNLLSWKIVLYPHAFLGYMMYMHELAAKLKYEYFCWNGRIYRTTDGSDSGMTIDDVA